MDAAKSPAEPAKAAPKQRRRRAQSEEDEDVAQAVPRRGRPRRPRPSHEPRESVQPEGNAAEEAKNEEDDESDGVEGIALGEDEFSRQQAIYAAQQRAMGLLSHVMDEEQLERHMASRRGTLNKASVRKLVNHVLSQTVNQHVVMAASGVGKVFVGEMVERARAVQREWGEDGALQPRHLYEAHRRYRSELERPGRYPPGEGAPGVGKKRRMF
ncbi:hypothetical protein MCUN1_003467 [Malassezia cuniculi]|uniref:TAFII28-like protein domain-containing protein n=1 Tax=Malassezia cuniculi TaxID=948313 RepID=A0AAF0J899_9BASI|nr:hypothetical protein MCUN1_003467 [Malassezia cuniculi]